MLQTKAFDFHQQIPAVYQAMGGLEQVIADQGIDPVLRHLVKLRASQINGCAYCVKMHSQEARKDGETNERLDRLVVWDLVDDFTEREKAALAWTEALTVLDRGADLSAVKARLLEHFSDPEVSTLTALIAMINLWNRMGIAAH
ncbi:carboxymuconolactone decarboxylase family protein [Pelagibius sp. CAU 1746]|uniref:carboxymuconolactone decarboxylase family protein n=1 Tax=Pelagibius sp. CAU 1746 TaxID=3140370 RepID=UPI00325B63E7